MRWFLVSVLIFLALLTFGCSNSTPEQSLPATEKPSPTEVVEVTSKPTDTPEPSRSTPTPEPSRSTPTPQEEPTATSQTFEVAVGISEVDGMEMIEIPAGEFEMGSEAGEPHERPVHIVYLDTFWIDKTEVTNAMYRMCVDAGGCQIPFNIEAYENDAYIEHPVVYVDWFDAEAYCEWAGRQLPTEAQWEKAARGPDGRSYPWGEGVDETLANYGGKIGDTTPVGSYPKGASPYGVLDMAGNVHEWVADWYDNTYYTESRGENPTGPETGIGKIVRGGSLRSFNTGVRTSFRFRYIPDFWKNIVGFRCAAPAQP